MPGFLIILALTIGISIGISGPYRGLFQVFKDLSECRGTFEVGGVKGVARSPHSQAAPTPFLSRVVAHVTNKALWQRPVRTSVGEP